MSTSVGGSPDGGSDEVTALPLQPSGASSQLRPSLARVLAPNPSVMTGQGTNSYVVGDHDLVVVDPGPSDPGHLARLLDQVSDRLRYVLVTHHHADHAPLARELADRAGVPLLAFGYEGLVAPDRLLRDGDVVELDDLQIRAVHTPGHASDHLCYLVSTQSRATRLAWLRALRDRAWSWLAHRGRTCQGTRLHRTSTRARTDGARRAPSRRGDRGRTGSTDLRSTRVHTRSRRNVLGVGASSTTRRSRSGKL